MSNIEFELPSEIRDVIVLARERVQRTVNSAMVDAYWSIGRLIVEHEQQGEARAAYGKRQLQGLAVRLTDEFGSGFDITNLRSMRRFYLAFPIRETVSPELSWSHYHALLKVDNPSARQWYMREAAEQRWSVRALKRQINVLYYERLLSSQDKATVQQEADQQTQPLQASRRAFLRDPYVLEFLNLPGERYLEADLERGLIDNLLAFLLELGKGFAFVGRQQRISVDGEDFYLDLVFYNFVLKCFMLIDLKLGKLTHQDVGQMDTYIRIYDEQYRGPDDNPTIGLILCSQKSEAVVKYSMLTDSEQIFTAQYLAHLPSEEELKRELELVRKRIHEQIASLAILSS
ncbi:PDDEXK nuclease domain-containing protein [Billgrantia aerodenitrificans]|uniref:DUF1016 domain-containing protein n=1 Tax=Billgrantia aerodenitrificans TaxID=2733483 RepID=A0ABS9ANJ4_9GAMM|nr:PDDEXK nuclease domain-containing protein [Halomonas aerodenitrificans]MCE8023155.1 DUF1016 domain-containing protein [Halomonas aerodenitrificans]